MRGFTLNFRNAQAINFTSMKNMVCSMDSGANITIENPSKITLDAKKRKIINKEEKKIYRLVYDKRILQDDYTTLPFGYK